MLEAFDVIDKQAMLKHNPDKTVTLRYDEREKSRHKTQTDCAKPIGWFIKRGHVLQEGEGLHTPNGDIIKVLAAHEPLSRVTSDCAHQLMRAAYHLGNRHVPLQVDADQLCYLCDYVLDDMVRGLGLKVAAINAPFTPEAGAYHSHDGASHAHSHSSSQSHTSKQGHSHSHSHSHS